MLAIVVAAGCARAPGLRRPGVSPAPQTPWVPPEGARRLQVRTEPKFQIPPELLESRTQLGLDDVIDIALRGSSQTRAAWAAAREAAAANGSEHGEYYPRLDLEADVNHQKSIPIAGRSIKEQTIYGANVDLGWLLIDFGGRSARSAQTRDALLAADWNHNAVIQNVILSVEQAYYNYVTAGGLLAAAESTVVEVAVGLDAANERHRAGVATIADVLQARTALSQAQLTVETYRGQIATTRGALATAMGLSADTEFDVTPPALEIPTEQVTISIQQRLAEAEAKRPDLAAAHAQLAQAEARVREVKAAAWPALTLSGSAGRFEIVDSGGGTTYSLELLASMPLFTGFAHHYDVRQSEAAADVARANLQSLGQTVILEVWTSYYDLATAEQRVRVGDDLLDSASESRDVALGRYRAGVGTILDLLTAEAVLANARAQQLRARADWFIALAQLAHDTGTLEPGSAVAAGSTGNATGSAVPRSDDDQ